MRLALPSAYGLGLLVLALTSCAQDPPSDDSPKPVPDNTVQPIPVESQRSTADVPTVPDGQEGLLLQKDSAQWRPPTDSSDAIEKRVPQTLNRLSPSSKRWASLGDYQRWFREFIERDKPPVEFYSGSVKHLDPSIFDIQPGDTIADIGCGTGTLEISFLSKEVPFEKFYGVDIDKESLDFFAFALETSNIDPDNRVEVVHSSLVDVRLPENSIDVMLVLYTRLMPPSVSDRNAHRNADFNALFTTIKKALKPGASFHMIDSMGEENAVVSAPPNRSLRNYGPEHVIDWMTDLGFELTGQSELPNAAIGERNYHLAFRYTD